MEIQFLKGIGEKRARLFNRLGLFYVDELLDYFPRAYEDRTTFRTVKELQSGEYACVRATVSAPVSHAYIRKGMELFKTKVFDGSGEIALTFFNAPYVKAALQTGGCYRFYGKTEGEGYRRQMVNPVFEAADKENGVTGCVIPLYHTTQGLSQGLLRSAVKQAISLTLENREEILPDELRRGETLCKIQFALEHIHFPKSPEALEIARRRLVFDELLLWQLGLSERRGRLFQTPGPVLQDAGMDKFWQALPFTPTEGQVQAICDILCDTHTGVGMNRLIQGDVGSGKTVVAAAAAFLACRNGYQSALMVPTEILAGQHAAELTPFFEKLGIQTGLLTGGGAAAARRMVRQGLENGQIGLCIGTHALLSDNVNFQNLGMVITDEQHRFGVGQRARLYEKGVSPHRLFMSATPIPRTLAHIIYGDLEVSLIKGMPPGRVPVKTYVVTEEYRDRIYGFIRKIVNEGGQTYIVCPLIEEDESLDLRSAEEYARQLSEKVDLRIGLVHGKLKAREREAVMNRFAAGELDILVATTVIEVGVNVPNAALMIVENAERFGLSQLHQLRGRVGRGKRESHCVLFLQSGGEVSRMRLDVMRRSSDGFEIAEADLRLRGPGDFFGRRQHGLPQFRIADLSGDMTVLERSKAVASALLQDDSMLEKPCHAALRRAALDMMERAEGGA